MNPFTQRIGIWYDTIENRDKVYEIMLSWFQNDENLYKTMCRWDGAGFYFKNGDSIRFVPYSESSRGIRLTDSYLINPQERHIKIIDCVIIPKTIFGDVYVLEDLSPERLFDEFRRKRKWRKYAEEFLPDA